MKCLKILLESFSAQRFCYAFLAWLSCSLIFASPINAFADELDVDDLQPTTYATACTGADPNDSKCLQELKNDINALVQMIEKSTLQHNCPMDAESSNIPLCQALINIYHDVRWWASETFTYWSVFKVWRDEVWPDHAALSEIMNEKITAIRNTVGLIDTNVDYSITLLNDLSTQMTRETNNLINFMNDCSHPYDQSWGIQSYPTNSGYIQHQEGTACNEWGFKRLLMEQLTFTSANNTLLYGILRGSDDQKNLLQIANDVAREQNRLQQEENRIQQEQNDAEQERYEQEKAEEAEREQQMTEQAGGLGFNFNVLNPFAPIFDAFKDSGCQKIPTIGSWLHNPNAEVCPIFPSSVRNVLTPVFSMFSMMLIFGYVIAWLNGGLSGGVHVIGGINNRWKD